MQFIVENEAFAKAMGLVKGSVKPSTIPILGHVAVEASPGQITVRGHNLEREVEAIVKADVSVAGGAALPGEVVAALVRRLPKGGHCEVKLDDDRARLVSGSSKYDLRTLPIADFPSRKELVGASVSTFTLAAGTLRDLLQTVSYATDPKHPHFYSRGVHLHIAGPKLIAVATDHHRLALRSTDRPTGAADMVPITVLCESVRAIIELVTGLDEPVEVAISEAIIQVKAGDTRLASALLDCKFPDYNKVIPKPNGASATFRPYALAEAIDRATVVYLGAADVSKRPPSVRVTTLPGTINLEAGAKGNETSSESVDAETFGAAVNFNVTAAYLTEMLKTWPEDVTLSMQHAGGAAKPVLFTAETVPDVLHVVMPTIF